MDVRYTCRRCSRFAGWRHERHVLALLSALAIYGLTNFALPRGGWDRDDDPTIQVERPTSQTIRAAAGRQSPVRRAPDRVSAARWRVRFTPA